MIKGTMNQLHNIHNPHQTKTKRVLTVCSAGLLRSPTTANVLHKNFGYNTRSWGTHDYALIPVSEALLKWADEVVFVNQENYDSLTQDAKELLSNITAHGATIRILNIPDMYEWGNTKLEDIILEQYREGANEQ